MQSLRVKNVTKFENCLKTIYFWVPRLSYLILTFPPQCYLLLFEISPILRIHQHQVQEVANGELFVDVSHCRRKLVPRQEHPDGYALA